MGAGCCRHWQKVCMHWQVQQQAHELMELLEAANGFRHLHQAQAGIAARRTVQVSSCCVLCPLYMLCNASEFANMLCDVSVFTCAGTMRQHSSELAYLAARCCDGFMALPQLTRGCAALAGPCQCCQAYMPAVRHTVYSDALLCKLHIGTMLQRQAILCWCNARLSSSRLLVCLQRCIHSLTRFGSVVSGVLAPKQHVLVASRLVGVLAQHISGALSPSTACFKHHDRLYRP